MKICEKHNTFIALENDMKCPACAEAEAGEDRNRYIEGIEKQLGILQGRIKKAEMALAQAHDAAGEYLGHTDYVNATLGGKVRCLGEGYKMLKEQVAEEPETQKWQIELPKDYHLESEVSELSQTRWRILAQALKDASQVIGRAIP